MIGKSEILASYSYNHEDGLFTPKNGNKVNPTTNKLGYVIIKIDGIRVLAHRAAWVLLHGNIDGMEIDHINGNPNDNRLANLRAVTHSENHKNRKTPKHNTSGYIGVSYDKTKSKWKSEITVDGKRITIGRFNKKEDAIKARASASEKHGFHKNHGRK